VVDTLGQHVTQTACRCRHLAEGCSPCAVVELKNVDQFQTSPCRLRAAVVVVYVSLRVIHALLLTFNLTLLLVQVIYIRDLLT